MTLISNNRSRAFSSSGPAGVFIGALAILAAGCNLQSPPPALQFEPNHVYAFSLKVQNDLESADGKDLTVQPLMDADKLLVEWFGTPDEPKLPPALAESSDYKDLLQLDRLKMAAGPAPAGTVPGDKGLYRQLCYSCHGETGSGRGTTAASQNPYPRDFRMGVFKFKSTPRNSKPLREDLMRILTKGLAGSQMPLFDKLSQSQLDALIDYVIYLSIRGETERDLLKMAAIDLDLEGSEEKGPDRLYSPEVPDKAKEQLESATEVLTAVADKWVNAKDELEEFTPPDTIPVPGMNDLQDEAAMAASIARGKELFQSETAACAKCHGENGRGDGKQAPDYDDWTKEWTAKASIQPTDVDAIRPLLAMGALPPQPLAPRNLAEGKLRGGFEPLDIYRRIRYGIAGSPMPAAALATSPGEAGIMPDDIWHIANYVRSLSQVTLTPAAQATASAAPTKDPAVATPVQ